MDPNTFGLTCGQEVFDKQWFGRVFLSLMSAPSYKIVSYQQYSYIVDYLNPDFFKDRVIILTKLFESGNKESLRFLDCGSFEMQGGESPMIFIRLNNPEKVHYDSQNPNYQNILFEKTQEKHIVSTEIMNHFFTRSFSNKERWNFIEDFFLGENNEELIRKYPGQDIKRIDVIKELSKKKVHVASKDISAGTNNAKMLYPPRPGKYTQKDHLTLEVEGEKVTHTIKEWILLDPITLHRAVKNKLIYVDSAFVYKPLMNAIEKNFPEYHTKLLGTKKSLLYLDIKSLSWQR